MAILGAGVIGLGASGKSLHCEPLAKEQGYRLAAVCDLHEDRLGEAERDFGAKGYRDAQGLIADPDVDLVVVALGCATHHPLAIAALDAGKHVVVEKPMCLSAEQAREMHAAARANGRILTVYQNRRWYSHFLVVRRVITDGLLGRVRVLHSCKSCDPDFWQSYVGDRPHATGAILEWGSHFVDQVLQILGQDVTDVFCIAQEVHGTGAEDYVHCTMRYPDGLAAIVEIDCVSGQPRRRWFAAGDRGSLLGEDGNSWGRILVRTDVDGDRQELEPPEPQGGHPYSAHQFYENLHAAITQGAELAVRPDETVRTMEVLDAARESARTGNVISL